MADIQLSLRGPERLCQLAGALDAQDGFADAVGALAAGDQATFDGVWGSACALLAAALQKHCPGTLVVVCAHAHEIDDFRDDLELFLDLAAERFPACEADAEERLARDENFGGRLRTLKLLGQATPPRLIVTSIQALMQPVPSAQILADATRVIEAGITIDLDELARWLVEHGFHSTTAVELPGEFSVRGGIIDIFAPDFYQPVRLELMGDEVDSIREIDVATQRSLQRLPAVNITVYRGNGKQRESFAAHLSPDSWLLLVEPQLINSEGRRYLEHLERPQDCHSPQQVLQRISQFPLALAWSLAQETTGQVCRLPIQSVERFSGDVKRVHEELQQVAADDDVFIVSENQAEVKRLQEIFVESQLTATGRLHFPIGHLKEGFRLVPEGLIVISGAELFRRTELRRMPSRRQGKVIDSFLDLREGDLVVHLAHGIGRYRGMKLITKDQHAEEHLEIEFHGATKIFVPASKIDLVQKYVGGRKARPMLARIGGKNWLRQKQAAQAAVTDLAADMLQLQAQRALRPGISFGRDSEWQREFDASFPYQETPDQLEAIDAIKNDMLSSRPMDRLLCGDVGFGKTELAMRAAFKTVDNGFQVAVLVPTTILAEQHFRTFSQRMAEFPFRVDKLSRFCTTAQQRDVIEGLIDGSVDIVIGTHRLASADVQFKNLGLLIIDEEQRFGVEVKDRLKSLRATVDVMTLSATPIPRTLHMSLTGMRDISNLETPPEDRLSVETRVTRWSNDLIRHAILRELSRGGQIFFVHNRVHDIQAVAQRLLEIVPDMRLSIGHGQMPEGELEQVMLDFVAGRFDLLLATTIVESGLDIPNANTIFIDDADRYGLADLHQLRGRVGRYKHRAYCYLLIDPRRSVTPNAARRLRAIEEFSDMGAGFAIAMRDLEIRGAGNVLGTQQSGHIATVGYELYCQLLESAIRRLKDLPPAPKIDVNVELPLEAHLPRDYVADTRARIDLYRRLARIVSQDSLEELASEFLDRFGAPPPAVQRLLALAALRLDAAQWQIDFIRFERPHLVFGYTDKDLAAKLAAANNGRLRIIDHRCAYLTLAKEADMTDGLIENCKSVLRKQ